MAAKLQEIDALDLSADELGALEKFLMDSLVEKDPGLGLSWVVGHYPDGKASTDYATAFRLWAMKDLTGATEWLDREIAAGKFRQPVSGREKRSPQRVRTDVIRLLTESDPAAIGIRLSRHAGRTTPRRDAGFLARRSHTRGSTGLCETDPRSLAAERPIENLFLAVRPPACRMAITRKSTEYLNLIHATPEERAVCAGIAAEHKFDKMKDQTGPSPARISMRLREWVGSQAPAAVDEITGNVLATIASKLSTCSTGRIHLQLRQQNGIRRGRRSRRPLSRGERQ